MHGLARLDFRDNEQLRKYYEGKYMDGGYGEGWLGSGFSVSRAYHAARFERATGIVASLKPRTLLDAGCGDGSLTAELAMTVPEVYGIDIAANAFIGAQVKAPGVKFSQMNIEAMTFPSGYFDAVVCVETLEHVMSPTRALSEMHRVTRPGGHLILTYPTVNRSLVKRLRLGFRIPMSEHLNEWSCNELLEKCRASGFRIEQVQGIAFDLGAINALKLASNFLSRHITKLSLSINGFPRNSLFVAVLATRPKN